MKSRYETQQREKVQVEFLWVGMPCSVVVGYTQDHNLEECESP